MQLGTHNQAAEAFAAAIARRMLSQADHPVGREVPSNTLAAMRSQAAELMTGIELSRQAVTQSLVQQQLASAESIAAVWPNDADMQLIARETSAKAVAGQSDAEDDAEADGLPGPRG